MGIFFSIIMPAWNRAEIISRAIESVKNQTFKNYELIIIDDGSEDNLQDAIAPYLSENLIYFRIPHSGASFARNKGISLSRGKYLAYLDTDNVWHPDFLEKMHKAFSEDNESRKVAYCVCNVFSRKDGGELLITKTYGEPFSFKKLVIKNYIDMNTFVHAKDCLDIVGLFDEQLGRLIDWDFILRITSKYDPIFIPEVLVDYYLGLCDNAITLNINLEKDCRRIKDKHRFRQSVISIFFDAIEYIFDDVTEKKFNNYVRTVNSDSRGKLDLRSYNLKDFKAWGYPYILQIEPTSLCNLACPLCPVGKGELGREQRNMTLNEFKAVVDDMEEYLLLLILWHWGEPFMNPDLPAMIRYASERGIKTVSSTNAHFLQNQAYVEEILNSGLSTLIVAVDSLDEERYLMYRKRGNFDKVISGLRNLIETKRRLKSKTLINLRMVIMKQNEHELSQMRRFAKGLKVDRFSVKTLNPSCDSDSADGEMLPLNQAYRRYVYKPGTNQRVPKNSACGQVWTIGHIYSNGDVVPCCYDYRSEMKVGNIFEKPFTQIWNSPEYCALRKRVFEQKNSIPKCRVCGINFQLSEKGWFVESRDFSKGLIERLRTKIGSMSNRSK